MRIQRLFIDERYVIGMDSRIVNTAYAHQHKTNWCWAANIEMSLSLAGLSVNQQDFAYNLCGTDGLGRIRNCPASGEQITHYLNGCGTDNFGERYCLETNYNSGAPSADQIIYYLQEGLPIILAYKEPHQTTGHAILLTGAHILETGYPRKIYIEHLIIRDPGYTIPNIMYKGRRVENAAELLSKTYSWWVPVIYCMDCGKRRIA